MWTAQFAFAVFPTRNNTSKLGYDFMGTISGFNIMNIA